MNQTKTLVDRCIKEVDKILFEENLEVDDLLKQRLVETAKRIANDTIGLRKNDYCATTYDPIRSPELLLWALSLVCEAWVLEIFRQKTQDGHCHTHKGYSGGKPCPNGSSFHRALFNEAKKSFQEILTNVEIPYMLQCFSLQIMSLFLFSFSSMSPHSPFEMPLSQ